jgi:excisionase family DNA binding protein
MYDELNLKREVNEESLLLLTAEETQDSDYPHVCSLKSYDWLTTKEAAEYLKVSVGSLRNMTSNGKIPYYKIPGTRLNRYLLSELKELLLAQKRGGSYGN